MLELAVKTEDTLSVVSVGGRLDAHSATEFSTELKDLLDAGATELWIDMSETVFIDSTGLAELVRFMKRARTNGGDLTLWKPSDAVRVILELTSLDLAFSISQAEQNPIESRRKAW